MPIPTRRYRTIADLPPVIPVFPLTGALLLPRTRLPLNIFEPRYLAMVDAAMDGYRLIGMIQPKTPGEDMAKDPPLAEIGCTGRIVEYSETDDGRYHITLAGLARFKVAGERTVKTAFREMAVDYGAFASDMVEASDPLVARDRLLAALKPYLTERQMKTDWQSIEEAPSEALINALCMICPFEPVEKQTLLEAATVKDRAETLIALLEIANASGKGGNRQPVH
jgi:Lon protease-like protein